jgi:hypothetical protein
LKTKIQLMSSEEDYDTSDEDLRDALQHHSSESESDEDESNAASHEVRVKVIHRILDHISDLPLNMSFDGDAKRTVSHFKEENFMPEGSQLETEPVYPDEDDEEHEEWSVYYSYPTENYVVEVRAFEEENYYYSVQVFHKHDRRIVNSGHVYTTNSVTSICEHLLNDRFKEAMLILFEKYGGGLKDQQPRNLDMLEWIAEESEVRSTTSGVDA